MDFFYDIYDSLKSVVSDVLNLFGFTLKDARIVFLGLDNAGKTTLLHMMRDKSLAIHEPTRHAQAEEFEINGCKFTTYDLGGHYAARQLWKDYLQAVDGVVYIVDVADENRLEESKEEFYHLLTEVEELKCVPILILGNKIDKVDAWSEREISSYFELDQYRTGKDRVMKGKDRALELFMCSIVEKSGFPQGFEWLSKQVQANFDKN